MSSVVLEVVLCCGGSAYFVGAVFLLWGSAFIVGVVLMLWGQCLICCGDGACNVGTVLILWGQCLYLVFSTCTYVVMVVIML